MAAARLEVLVVQPRILTRAVNAQNQRALLQAGVPPLLARLWAARGIAAPGPTAWGAMIPPRRLTHAQEAAALLADAIAQKQRLLVIADYDCDGATACAVAVRALRAMGARVDFLVPNRFTTGYGLSPAVVELACHHPAGRPDLLITVDNGIASLKGVAAANEAGMAVLVTDHHLPGARLPDARVVVNPNQPGCGFPSKNLAGVGVIFYTMLALRAELRQRGVLAEKGGPGLESLADLVALGTVADVVKLDANNRLLIGRGLKRIRSGRLQAGMSALFEVAGREPRQATTADLGFCLGPRINAAGRMADMRLGIECLLTDDPLQARDLAQKLDEINRTRRAQQTRMSTQALEQLKADTRQASLCVRQADWHSGIIGLIASQLKESTWCPVIAFAPDAQACLRGSGRSIPEVHLRDALDLVSKRLPGAIVQFGGHAMAAGLTLKTEAFESFSRAFDDAVRTLSGRECFEPCLETDGSLALEHMTAETAQLICEQIWGAGFPEPLFLDEFRVAHQRVLKGRHLKLCLERGDQAIDAIWFGRATTLPDRIEAAYRLQPNTWNGQTKAQLLIEYAHG